MIAGTYVDPAFRISDMHGYISDMGASYKVYVNINLACTERTEVSYYSSGDLLTGELETYPICK